MKHGSRVALEEIIRKKPTACRVVVVFVGGGDDHRRDYATEFPAPLRLLPVCRATARNCSPALVDSRKLARSPIACFAHVSALSFEEEEIMTMRRLRRDTRILAREISRPARADWEDRAE